MDPEPRDEAPTVTVIVPTLDEAAHLPGTLRCLDRQAGVEIIVVDGGSTDATVDLARGCGVDRVMQASRGRASQMNAGAAAARGDVLLFLHADTALEPGALAELRAAMRDRRIVAGAFRMRIDSARRRVRWVAGAVNLRSRLMRLPYGDQGIFVRREVFEQMQGFRPLPIMEDLDLIQRVRRRGRLTLLRTAATTSGRRWEANGVLRTTLANWLAAGLYGLGVAPERIGRLYERTLKARPAPGTTPGSAPGTPPAGRSASTETESAS